MYQLLVLFTGVIISVMVSTNGDLSQSLGTYYAAVIIHIVGTGFAFILCLLKKQKINKKVAVPFWAYLGGAIGAVTTLSNTFAYSQTSMRSLVALGLLGQTITSNIIDTFGWFGMKKHPMRNTTWVGLALSFVGLAVMMDYSDTSGIIAVIVCLFTGVTVVTGRSINSRLSNETGALVGSFYNHVTGLPICIVLSLLLPTTQTITLSTVKPWMFLGGTMGVLVVTLYNITVPKVSAFRLTLLAFIGQVFSGIVIDVAYGKTISPKLFWGSVLISMGLLLSMTLEYLSEKSFAKEKTF